MCCELTLQLLPALYDTCFPSSFDLPSSAVDSMNMGSLRQELMMPHPHTFLAEDEDEDELETGGWGAYGELIHAVRPGLV